MLTKGKFSRDEILLLAEEAKSYARSQIIKGGTQLENNDLPDEYYESLIEGIETQVRSEIKIVANNKLSLNPEKSDFLAKFESTIEVTAKFSLGNCHELAVQALNYILNSKTDINAELYHIIGGDHVILVLNRNPSSNPSSPKTWGDDAIICDPWSNKVYGAKKYKDELKNFHRAKHRTSNARKSPNTIEPFDVTRHRLRPLENYNIDTIKKLREIAKLKIVFLQESNRIKKILADYKGKLIEERKRLAKKYDDKNMKLLTFSHLISGVDIFISSIKEIENNLSLEECGPNYDIAKGKLNDKLRQVHQLAERATLLSPAEKSILYSHSARDNKTKLLKLFNVPSETEKNLESIFKEVDALLETATKIPNILINASTSRREP